MSARYPLQALVAASGLTEAELGRRVGLSGSTLKHVREHGLAERSADRYAVRAGMVPSAVWPELLEQAIADVTRECASSDCTNTFLLDVGGKGGTRRRYGRLVRVLVRSTVRGSTSAATERMSEQPGTAANSARRSQHD
jgi:hypothetical protein